MFITILQFLLAGLQTSSGQLRSRTARTARRKDLQQHSQGFDWLTSICIRNRFYKTEHAVLAVLHCVAALQL